jgi:hypothetical protein
MFSPPQSVARERCSCVTLASRRARVEAAGSPPPFPSEITASTAAQSKASPSSCLACISSSKATAARKDAEQRLAHLRCISRVSESTITMELLVPSSVNGCIPLRLPVSATWALLTRRHSMQA